MATLIFGAAGAAIGSAFGPAGWKTGFDIGIALGSFFDPGPAIGVLNDRMVSGSQYGTDIPRLWGNARIAGQIIWAKQDAYGNVLVPHSGSKKKGGPQVYSYSATFAVAFNQSSMVFPDLLNPLGGSIQSQGTTLVRLHADGKVVYGTYVTYNGNTPNTYNATYWTPNNQFVWVDGHDPQTPNSTIVGAMGVPSSQAIAFPGLSYAVFNDVNLNDFGNRIPNLEAEVSTTGGAAANVSVILTDLCALVGIPSAQVDVSQVTQTIDGVLVTSRSSPSETILTLCKFFLLDVGDVDGMIRFIPRGGNPVMTINTLDLGAASGNGAGPTYDRTRLDTTQLPGAVDLEYFDVNLLRQFNSQSAMRPGIYHAARQRVMVPFSLQSGDAAQGAGRILDDIWAQTEKTKISLPPSYLQLAPGDPIILPVAEGNKRYRVTGVEIGPMAELLFELASDGSGLTNQNGTGATGSGGMPAPPNLAGSDYFAWSGIEIQDSDQGTPGFYVAVAPNGAGGWPGAQVYWSPDSGTTWIPGPTLSGASLIGVTTSTLSTAGAVANTWDTTNTFGVDFTASLGSMTSVSSDEVLSADSNQFNVDGEYMGVQGATLTAQYKYTLSDLFRGERSTPITAAPSGSNIVQLSRNLGRVTVAASLIGHTVWVKAVTIGQSLASVIGYQSITIATPTPSATENLGTEISNLDMAPTFLSPVQSLTGITNGATWYTFQVTGAKYEVLVEMINIVANGTYVQTLTGQANGGTISYPLFCQPGTISNMSPQQAWIPCDSSGKFQLQVVGPPSSTTVTVTVNAIAYR